MAQAFLSSGFVGGRPARLGSETFTANGTYNANNFNNAKGQPLDGFSQVTVNTPYEAILDGSVETIDTSVTTLRASAFANMTNLTKLVLRNASSLLSTIQNALPTDLSQGAELNIYVPSPSLEDYADLYGSVYTVNDISAYGRYWFTPTTSETTLTSDMYVSGIMAYSTSTDPYDGLQVPRAITALGSGSLTPITSPTSTLGIYDLRFEGDITAFANTALTSIDSNFANSACPIKKFRYGGTSLKQYTLQSPIYPFFYGCASIKEIYLTGMSVINCFSYGASFVYPNTVFEYISSNAASMSLYCFSGSTSLKKASLNAMASFAEYGFGGCTALVSVSAKSLTAIGIGAFDGCSALKSIPNQTSIASIGEMAFKNCSSLTQANLPLVTAIPYQCFVNCSKLVSCDTPLATSVGTYGFAHCVSLTALSFPSMNSSSSSIGTSMISNCSSLATLYIGTSAMSSAPTLVGLSAGFSSSLLVHVPFAGTTGNMLATFWNSTNWASMTAYLVGDLVASVGDILAGTSAYGSTTYNCKWYSDERCTIQVNTTGSSFSVATAGTYYCKLVAQ